LEPRVEVSTTRLLRASGPSARGASRPLAIASRSFRSRSACRTAPVLLSLRPKWCSRLPTPQRHAPLLVAGRVEARQNRARPADQGGAANAARSQARRPLRADPDRPEDDEEPLLPDPPLQ